MAVDPQAALVDKILSPLRGDHGPGCAAGVIQNGRFLYKTAFGQLDLDGLQPVTTDTAFNVASMSKQFTAAALYVLLSSGKVRLNDPVRQFIPELPAYAEAITLEDLLHHTSGLRDVAPLLEAAGREDESLDVAASLKLLAAQSALNFTPGSDYAYTNSDYLLLGLVIERASGIPFASFAEERIFKPLGMTNSQFNGQYEKLRERAAGYAPRGNRYRKITSPLLLSGDGGLFTTVEDLLRWDDAFYNGKLGGQAFTDFMQARGKFRGGAELPYASGLIMGRYAGLPVVSHPGSLPGYRSEMIRFPAQRFTVVCLCNRGDADSAVIARQIARVYLYDKLRPLKGRAQIIYANSGFPELDGVYESKQGWIVRTWSRVDGLTVQMADGEYQLAPLNQRELFADTGTNRLLLTKVSKDEFTLAWDRFPSVSYRRLESALPKPDELESFTGDFRSTDADVRYRIALDGEVLRMSVLGGWTLPLDVIGSDRFLAGPWSLRFVRGAGGQIQGLQLHSERLWNLWFGRIAGPE